jgi:hypothetical protein
MTNSVVPIAKAANAIENTAAGMMMSSVESFEFAVAIPKQVE